MGFSRQEYWNGLPFPPPGDLPDPGTIYIHRGLPGDPDPGIEPASLKFPALAGEFFTTSNTWKAPICAVPSRFSCVRLFVTLWTVACQAPLSMEFSRQEYWSGLPFPPPRDLPNAGIKPESPTLQVESSPSDVFFLDDRMR